MLIREFKDTDLKHINDFFVKRETKAIELGVLPQHGLIAFEAGIPIAAGFLRCVEGQMAMLDSYITDPLADAALRDIALGRLTAKLIKLAKANNINKLMAFSVDKNTLLRACNHGFSVFPHVFTMLNLT